MPSGGESIVIPQRWLMVVARDRPRLYANLRESFEGNPLVAVIVDRRQADPGGAAATPADEAQIRRRQPLSPEQTGTWLQLGFILVRQEDGLAVYEAARP
jgi:hypothetical protein